jgi:hypothetical protein
VAGQFVAGVGLVVGDPRAAPLASLITAGLVASSRWRWPSKTYLASTGALFTFLLTKKKIE